MEAAKVPEEPHITMDAEEHPTSKDSCAEESQELPNSEHPLETSSSQTPTAPETSEAPFTPSSQTHLGKYVSESSLGASVFETSLENPTSEIPMSEPPTSEPPTSEAPVVSSTSQVFSETYGHKFPLKKSTSKSLVTPQASKSFSKHSVSEIALVPYTYQFPLETFVSDSPAVPSTSQTQLTSQTSQNLLKSFLSDTTVELRSTSEISLEAPTSETRTSRVPKKRQPSQSTSAGSVSMFSIDLWKKDFFSEIPPDEVSQTRRSSWTSEFELLAKDSVSELSAVVHTNIASTQKKEATEEERSVDISDIISYTSQPEPHLDRKKGKKGTNRYTSFPVIPTNREELMEIVKAREQFGAQLNHLFRWEKSEALNAIQTGVYIGWRCPHYLWDCFRIGEESKCFCGHLLKEHRILSDMFVPCSGSQCRCLMFCFIPSRPEEVGEFWLKRRAAFDPNSWRAQCRCKHSHEEHAATGIHTCKYRGCGCKSFESNFLCAACDRRWEEHETFFEMQGNKRRKKKCPGSQSSSSWHRAF
ncbi:protein FAM221B isoform 1-T1 [Thomomys bottae]